MQNAYKLKKNVYPYFLNMTDIFDLIFKNIVDVGHSNLYLYFYLHLHLHAYRYMAQQPS